MSACPHAALFGRQETTDEDLRYSGSTFSEIRTALFENPYQRVWGAANETALPIYEATFGQAFCGALPGGKPDQLLAAAERTVDTRADLRWGTDRKGFRRIVHPNGICLLGTWTITSENPYSGYFRPGSRGLVIARFSSNTVPLRGERKSLSLVGKLFATTDENHADKQVPASFFTQQDFGNESTEYVNDAAMSNSPNVTALRRFPIGALILARLGRVFRKVDQEPDIRQLHEVAELGKAQNEPANTPEFMMLQMTPGQRRVEGQALDFRDEIYGLIYDRGNPAPQRVLTFDIFIANEGKTKRFTGAFKRVHVPQWEKIGQMRFNEAVASYNGDHVIHFHHPHWRQDKNDASTAVRVNGRRVR